MNAAVPGTRCRICRCGAYLVDDHVRKLAVTRELLSLTNSNFVQPQGPQPGCVCGHGQHDHGPPSIVPSRHCENGDLFVTVRVNPSTCTNFLTTCTQTEHEPTARSICSRCHEAYFMHLLPEDMAPPAQTPSRGSEFVPLAPGTASSPPSSGMSSTTGSNRTTSSFQSYLQPPLSPLQTAGAVSSSPSTMLQMWSRPGPPPSGSVNDRRMQSATAARGISASPYRTFPSRVAQIPTGPRTASMGVAPPATGVIRNVRTRNRTSHGGTLRKYLIVIHPEPVSTFVYLDAFLPTHLNHYISHVESMVLPSVVIDSRPFEQPPLRKPIPLFPRCKNSSFASLPSVSQRTTLLQPQ